MVVGPNGVHRSSYDFKAHKDDIVTTLNELGKAVVDVGLTAVLRQHTGTCVETRDETYAVMAAVDTRVMKFGPDIGQLQKGLSDPGNWSEGIRPLQANDFASIFGHLTRGLFDRARSPEGCRFGLIVGKIAGSWKEAVRERIADGIVRRYAAVKRG